MDRPRYLKSALVDDALASRKMAFVSGPRQVGKSTVVRALLRDPRNDYLYDDEKFRRAWSKSPSDALLDRGEGPVVLDEIHKDRRWKNRVKALYDTHQGQLQIIVTGSAKLDLFRQGSDSLLGRYLPYRLHPFSVAESTEVSGSAPSPDEILQHRQVNYPWQDLMTLGGFPEPLLGGTLHRARRWSRLRLDRLVHEDARDLRAIEDLQAFRNLALLVAERTASLRSINSLHRDIGKAYATTRSWMSVLDSLYHTFTIAPYAKKLPRALRAEPKLYVYDLLQVPAEAQAKRLESLTALHLLKACHYWTDTAQGEFGLHFVRTKDGKEVDFLVLRDGRPWMLVECKSGDTQPSRELVDFAELFEVEHAVQLVTHSGYDRHHPARGVRVMSYEAFASGLV